MCWDFLHVQENMLQNVNWIAQYENRATTQDENTQLALSMSVSEWMSIT